MAQVQQNKRQQQQPPLQQSTEEPTPLPSPVQLPVPGTGAEPGWAKSTDGRGSGSVTMSVTASLVHVRNVPEDGGAETQALASGGSVKEDKLGVSLDTAKSETTGRWQSRRFSELSNWRQRNSGAASSTEPGSESLLLRRRAAQRRILTCCGLCSERWVKRGASYLPFQGPHGSLQPSVLLWKIWGGTGRFGVDRPGLLLHLVGSHAK
jgi:hypothetical protein